MKTFEKYLNEGRSTTPKYVVDVKLKSPKWSSTPSAWESKQAGKPTEQNLAKWVKMYNDSIKPGGVNDHLGPEHELVWAGIRLNQGMDKSYIAEWGKK